MEIQLANKLGVSRTPIREAIRKLELEGLVLMIPRKGSGSRRDHREEYAGCPGSKKGFGRTGGSACM